MYSVLICTHCNISSSLLEAVELLRGKSDRLDSIGIFPESSVASVSASMDEKIRRLKANGDVVVLSDMVLGTPFNILLSKTVSGEVRHISGVNLPLILSLMENCTGEADTDSAIRTAIDAARAAVVDVRDLIKAAGRSPSRIPPSLKRPHLHSAAGNCSA